MVLIMQDRHCIHYNKSSKRRYFARLSKISLDIFKPLTLIHKLLLITQIILYILYILFYNSIHAILLVILSFLIIPAYVLSFILKNYFNDFISAFHIASSLMLGIFIATSLINKYLFNTPPYSMLILNMLFFIIIFIISIKYGERINYSGSRNRISEFLKHTISYHSFSHLLAIIVLLVASFYLVSSLSYIPVYDEEAYIYNMMFFDKNDLLLPYNPSMISHETTKYFSSRFLWSLYLFAIYVSSHVYGNILGISNILFLSLVASISVGLFREINLTTGNIRVKTWLEYLLLILIFFSPSILLWARTVFLDLMQSYFILLSIYFAVHSIKIKENRKIDIVFGELFLSILYGFIAIILKINILSLIMFSIIFVVLLYKKRSHLTLKAKRTINILMVLLILGIIYFLIFDLGWFIARVILGNYELARTLHKYLFYRYLLSLRLLGIFIKVPGEPYTIFSYNLMAWIEFFNKAFIPESLTILMISTFLSSPLLLFINGLKGNDNFTKYYIVFLTTYMSFWLYFISLIGTNLLYLIHRYGIHLYVLVLVVSIAILHRIFSDHVLLKKFAPILSIVMLIVLGINMMTSLEYGGSNYFYYMGRYPYSPLLLLGEYGVVNYFLYRSLIKNKNYLPIILAILIIFTGYFSYIVLERATYVFTPEYLGELPPSKLENIRSFFDNIDSKHVFIISNIYLSLRNYLDLEKYTIIPPPINEKEFREMLQILPNNTYLVLSDHNGVARYEYSNVFKGYIKEYYVGKSFIPIKYVNISYKLLKPVLEINASNIYMLENIVFHGTIIETKWGNAIKLSGDNSYIVIKNFSLNREFTIEFFFRLDEEINDLNYYSRTLLVKKSTPDNILVEITSDHGFRIFRTPYTNSFLIRTRGDLVEKNHWCHLVIVSDGEYVKIYVNGLLEEVKRIHYTGTGFSQQVKDKPIYIGVNGYMPPRFRHYLRATILYIRIYDRALNETYFKKTYYYAERVNVVETGEYKHVIYRVIRQDMDNNVNPVEIKVLSVRIGNITGKYPTCIVDLWSNDTTILFLATTRFTEIINVTKGYQSIEFPHHIIYRYKGSAKKLYIAKLVCSFFTITDNRGRVLAYHVDKAMNTVELTIYITTLLTLLVIPITTKAWRENKNIKPGIIMKHLDNRQN